MRLENRLCDIILQIQNYIYLLLSMYFSIFTFIYFLIYWVPYSTRYSISGFVSLIPFPETRIISSNVVAVKDFKLKFHSLTPWRRHWILRTIYLATFWCEKLKFFIENVVYVEIHCGPLSGFGLSLVLFYLEEHVLHPNWFLFYINLYQNTGRCKYNSFYGVYLMSTNYNYRYLAYTVP